MLECWDTENDIVKKMLHSSSPFIKEVVQNIKLNKMPNFKDVTIKVNFMRVNILIALFSKGTNFWQLVLEPQLAMLQESH